MLNFTHLSEDWISIEPGAEVTEISKARFYEVNIPIKILSKNRANIVHDISLTI